jgi:hypothetical protein
MSLIRRAVISPFIAILLLAVFSPVSSAGAASTAVPAGVVTNANWIMGAVVPGGAIGIYPGSAPYSIEPYFANYAAMGLSRAALLTGNTSYANAAWNWLAWYAAHEDANGFVTDYTMTASGVASSTGNMDSTDSYAATFLSAVGMAYPTDPSRTTALLAGIHGAIKAILATQDSDGLTWAKPNYQVKYLMDNGEVYDGLIAAKRVLTAVGDTKWASLVSAMATNNLNGLSTMWNTSANDFNWAKFPGGGQQTTNWSVLYPDALEQASAAAFHVAFGHATALMSTFDTLQPSATSPAIAGYQPFAVIGLEATGAATQGMAEAHAIDAYAASTNFAWPYNVAAAGQQVFGDSDSALVGA